MGRLPYLLPSSSNISSVYSMRDGEWALLFSHKAAKFQNLIEQQKIKIKAIINNKLS